MTTTRWAGLLYLALAVLAPFSVLYVPSQILVAGDGVASMGNVLAHQGLFRAGMAADAMVFLIEIVLTTLLFRLFEPINRTLSLMAAFARLAMTVLQGVSLGVSLVTLRFAESGQPELVLVSLLAHADSVLVWQAFFGLHCLLLGILVYRSRFIPKPLGVLLMVASAGYLSDSFGRFAWSSYGETFGWVVAPLVIIGELSFTAWLLISTRGDLPALVHPPGDLQHDPAR